MPKWPPLPHLSSPWDWVASMSHGQVFSGPSHPRCSAMPWHGVSGAGCSLDSCWGMLRGSCRIPSSCQSRPVSDLPRGLASICSLFRSRVQSFPYPSICCSGPPTIQGGVSSPHRPQDWNAQSVALPAHSPGYSPECLFK